MAVQLKNHNIIFIHPPKCGGSSVAQELQSIDGLGPNVGKGAHRTIQELKDIGHEADEYFVTVRNPYDRYHSYYHFCIEWDKKRIDGELRLKDMDRDGLQARRNHMIDLGFDGFVNLLLDQEKITEFVQNHQLKKAFKCQHIHWLDQTDKPVHIFQIEQGGVWKYLQDLGYPVKLRHTKKSTYRTKPYTLEQKEIVYEYFKEDFELLGYDK